MENPRRHSSGHRRPGGILAARLSRAARSLLSLNRGAELRALVELMGLAHGHRLLDVGSGDGFWSQRFARKAAEVVAIDPDEELLSSARELFAAANLRYDQGSAESLPYDNESFDRVVSVNAVEHFDNPVAALREMARTLRAGGVLAISVDSLTEGNSTDGFRHWHADRHYVNTYFDRDHLIAVLKDAGLDPDHDSIQGLFVSRWAGRARELFIRRPRLMLPAFPAFFVFCKFADRLALGGTMDPQILIVRAAKPSS